VFIPPSEEFQAPYIIEGSGYFLGDKMPGGRLPSQYAVSKPHLRLNRCVANLFKADIYHFSAPKVKSPALQNRRLS
jgi:hypothetical protein